MFKSKYGLISAILVVFVFGIGYFWASSYTSKQVTKISTTKLTENDSLFRYTEVQIANEAIAKTSDFAAQIRPLVVKLTDLQQKLSKQMNVEIQQMAKDGEVPAFLAIGDNSRDMIYWLGINGKDTYASYAFTLNSSKLVSSLLSKYPQSKSIKQSTVSKVIPNKKDRKNRKSRKHKKAGKVERTNTENSLKPVKVPLLFPSETEDKILLKPSKEDSYKVGTVKETYRLPIFSKLAKKGDKLEPIIDAYLVAGFNGSKTGFTRKIGENLVLRIGRNSQIRQIVMDITNTRKSLFETVNKFRKQKSVLMEGSKPYIIVITDNKGVILTRDKDDSKISGFNYIKRYPNEMALLSNVIKQQKAGYDIWEQEVINAFKVKSHPANLHYAASVPIWGNNGKVVAVFSIAWPYDTIMSRLQKETNFNMGFFYNKELYANNFKGQSSAETVISLKETFKGRLASSIISPLVKSPKAKISGETITLAGTNYKTAYYLFPQNTLSGKSHGYIMLLNKDKIYNQFKSLKILILVFGLFMLLLVILMEQLIFSYFYSAVDALEEGVKEVTAGDMDYVFGTISKETEGLANSLNEMLNVIFGRAEIDSETGEEGVKEGIQLLTLGQVPEIPYVGNEKHISRILDLSETDYLNQLYSQFKNIWEELGEESDIPSMDSFKQRVKLFERMVLRQLKCERVVFGIELSDNDDIILIPYPVS